MSTTTINFVSDHPEFVTRRQPDPNAGEPLWQTVANLKAKKLETAGIAANQLCTTLQDEINELTAELRKTKAMSPAGTAAISDALSDAQRRLAEAKVDAHARMSLAERARKALRTCDLMHSTAPQRATPGKTLKAIRAEIERIKSQLLEVQNAQRPLAELESELRAYLSALAQPRTALVDLCAGVLASSTPIKELTGHPNLLAGKAFGLALSSIGVDSIVDEALSKAKANDTGVLRITAEERTDRLAELAKALYLAELDEEMVIGDNDRRADVNAAAVLQIPLDVAEQAQLLPGVK